MNSELQWHPGLPETPIPADQVHVWHTRLDLPLSLLKKLPASLSADEIARAKRFHFEKDQNRFVAARGILRIILGHYLDKAPQQILLEYNPYGKPMLAPVQEDVNLRFNLSHSGEIALFAFSKHRDVGIDVEQIKEDLAIDQIASWFFSPHEIRSLEATPENERTQVFFQFWSRKEAFLKASGEGISFPPEQVDVSEQNGGDWSPVRILDHRGDNRQWCGKDLSLFHGYAAAVVVEAAAGDLLYREFSGNIW